MSDLPRVDRLRLSRRDWLKASGVVSGTAVGAQLACTAAASGCDVSPNTADLRNPEQQAGTERIKHYLRRSRELALAELKPTSKQIDRALTLHAESIVCDPMGGSLTSGGLYSPALDKRALSQLARLLANQDGPITGEQLDQITTHVDKFRPFELISNPVMQRDHQAVLRASGRTLSTTGAEPWTAPGSNLDWHTYLVENLHYTEKVTLPEQAAKLKQEGRFGAIWCNHAPLNGADTPMKSVDMMYLLGVRQAMPGCSMDDEGRAVVRRMNQLGMVVDTAHNNELAIVAASNQPVLCSHTCCRAVHHGYAPNRNMTDEGLQAIADTGGVVAITTVSTLAGGVEGYTIAGGMAHIRHAVKLIGAEHVGVSSDRGLTWAGLPPELLRAARPANLIPFEQAPRYPGGWGDINMTYRETWEGSTQPHALKPCAWPYNVTLPLVMEGYSDQQIRDIIGGSVMRLYEQILARQPTVQDV